MLLKITRVWLPAALCIAGIGVIIAGSVSVHSLEVGIPLFSAGASIWLFTFLYRVGVHGDVERGGEEEAREFFAKHGHWPDEPGPGHQA